MMGLGLAMVSIYSSFEEGTKTWHYVEWFWFTAGTRLAGCGQDVAPAGRTSAGLFGGVLSSEAKHMLGRQTLCQTELLPLAGLV